MRPPHIRSATCASASAVGLLTPTLSGRRRRAVHLGRLLILPTYWRRSGWDLAPSLAVAQPAMRRVVGLLLKVAHSAHPRMPWSSLRSVLVGITSMALAKPASIQIAWSAQS